MSEQLISSSAHKNNSDPVLQLSAKSLIKIINNKGFRIKPCGIPLRTSYQKGKKLLILPPCSCCDEVQTFVDCVCWTSIKTLVTSAEVQRCVCTFYPCTCWHWCACLIVIPRFPIRSLSWFVFIRMTLITLINVIFNGILVRRPVYKPTAVDGVRDTVPLIGSAFTMLTACCARVKLTTNYYC